MKQVDGQTAEQISEMLLELTGSALLSDNFSLFAQCFHLPHTIETPDKKRVLETTKDLENVFDSVTADYKRRRITELVRICEVAEFKSETLVHATHITHMMSGAQRVNDPFPNFSVLELIDGRWQITSSQYAVDKNTTVGRALNETLAQDAADAALGKDQG